jgi:hypothetical protein
MPERLGMYARYIWPQNKFIREASDMGWACLERPPELVWSEGGSNAFPNTLRNTVRQCGIWEGMCKPVFLSSIFRYQPADLAAPFFNSRALRIF